MVLHEHKVIGNQSLSQADLLKKYHSWLHWKLRYFLQNVNEAEITHNR